MIPFHVQIKASLTVKSDAVATIGIVRRRGLGRIRNLAVADLWVQQRAKHKEGHYQKLDGSKNTSDMLTKPVEKDTLNGHMERLGFEFRQGRHVCTPAFTGKEGEVPAGT